MSQAMNDLRGSLVALVTPMTASGAIDWLALDGLVIGTWSPERMALCRWVPPANRQWASSKKLSFIVSISKTLARFLPKGSKSIIYWKRKIVMPTQILKKAVPLQRNLQEKSHKDLKNSALCTPIRNRSPESKFRTSSTRFW